MAHPFLDEAAAVIGAEQLITDPAKMAKYCHGFRYGTGPALAVARPQTLYALWQLAELCVKHDLIIITQASNTGLTGGSTPYGEYDRPVVLISTSLLKGIQLIDNDRQAIALPGATLFELEDVLRAKGREPHSVIGSSCIGASIIGGICNNSGGALIRRGPAYTELALYARKNEAGVLELHNELGIALGDDPKTILTRLQNGDYRPEAVEHPQRLASDHEYGTRVRDVDADTPARFNNDGRRLYGASGSAGRLLVFAVRVDTFEKPPREQVFYIGSNDPADLSAIRRHILKEFKELPISGEYIHRDYFDISERYGRDTVRVIHSLGSKYIPKLFALKNTIDRIAGKFPFMPRYLSDRMMQWFMNVLPSHLPRIFHDFRANYEHHLILKMADEGIEQAHAFLKDYFKEREGDFHPCTPEEGAWAILHRFAAAGAATRYQKVHHKKVGEVLALDVALRRNEEDWFEHLPADIAAQMEKKLYCGHFFCHVMHQDYILKKDADPVEIKHRLLAFFDERGAEYPAEHNVGHLYPAKAPLQAFYRKNDPTNSLNPGIGKTSRAKNWADSPAEPNPFALEHEEPESGCGCGCSHRE